jgi:hypothetical protein
MRGAMPPVTHKYKYRGANAAAYFAFTVFMPEPL